MSQRKNSLIRNDALMHRTYFKEMLRLMGIDSMYYQVDENTRNYNEVGEFSASYLDPVETQVIFDQVPTVRTLKKLGWTTELDETLPLIHIDYDLPEVQVGALFSIEDPMRPGKGKLFRATKLSSGIIYPANLTCQLAPVLGDQPENTLRPETAIEKNREAGKNIVRPENYD